MTHGMLADERFKEEVRRANEGCHDRMKGNREYRGNMYSLEGLWRQSPSRELKNRFAAAEGLREAN